MAALGWLLNLGMAGSGTADVAVTAMGVNPRIGYTHRRKRPYQGWMTVLKPARRLADARALLAHRA